MEIRINPDQVPSTVDEAVWQIVAGMDDELEEVLKGPTRQRTLSINGREVTVDITPASEIHHGIGTGLRNCFSLWEDSPVRRDAISTYGVAHGDDVYQLIIEKVTARVRGEEFDAEAFTRRIRDHWARSDLTPLSAAGLDEDGNPLLY